MIFDELYDSGKLENLSHSLSSDSWRHKLYIAAPSLLGYRQPRRNLVCGADLDPVRRQEREREHTERVGKVLEKIKRIKATWAVKRKAAAA